MNDLTVNELKRTLEEIFQDPDEEYCGSVGLKVPTQHKIKLYFHLLFKIFILFDAVDQ